MHHTDNPLGMAGPLVGADYRQSMGDYKSRLLGCDHGHKANFPVKASVVQRFRYSCRLIELGPELVPRSFTVIEHLSDIVRHVVPLLNEKHCYLRAPRTMHFMEQNRARDKLNGFANCETVTANQEGAPR
jgi:hypothetical protein